MLLLAEGVILFIMGCRKTVALILVELARDPHLQSALRQELVEFVGSGSNSRPTYDEYLGSAKLPLLDAVVNEGYVAVSLPMCRVSDIHTQGFEYTLF